MQGSQSMQAAQASQPIQGSSGLVRGMQDIHDIKPPVEVGIDPAVLNFIIAAIALLLSLAAGYFLFRYIKKRLNKHTQKDMILLPPPLPPLPPDEAALRELSSIADLITTDPRLYYFRITALVKTFIGKMFDINAPEMTTQEIICAINTLKIEKSLISPLREFFLSSSMVKYAAVMPELDQMKSDEQFVRQFIDSVMAGRLKSDENENENENENKQSVNLTKPILGGGEK